MSYSTPIPSLDKPLSSPRSPLALSRHSCPLLPRPNFLLCHLYCVHVYVHTRESVHPSGCVRRHVVPAVRHTRTHTHPSYDVGRKHTGHTGNTHVTRLPVFATATSGRLLDLLRPTSPRTVCTPHGTRPLYPSRRTPPRRTTRVCVSSRVHFHEPL